ncbi:hypothetical protein PVAND_009228 [Polypedilum vanderplanki]|uniref:Uncharacterized protein n=1 Tax=Polypedilum vanderplanki TaxID=319348 RepID=A0A9J6CC89_POLVA|nr:hypothetical protein PVAND_009228 [Polypedilum vanderplanki]
MKFIKIQIYGEAETIDCNYYESLWVDLEKLVYYCDVRNPEIFSNELRSKILSASGQHKNGFSNIQVRGIKIEESLNDQFFPSNIIDIFPNHNFRNVKFKINSNHK